MKKIILLILVTIFRQYAFACVQDGRKEEYLKVAKAFIENYNQQDYKRMRAPFSGIAKIVISNKKLRKIFDKKYTQYGKMILLPDGIRYPTERTISIHFKYEKDTLNFRYFQLTFTSKNKIIGLGFQEDYFVYPLIKIPLPNLELSIDSILNNSFSGGFNGEVLFMDKNRIRFKKAYGYSDMDKKTPLNDSSLFELASCSKQFTAAAILKLQELGKLSLNDSLRKFFPELPFHHIIIKQLLWHISGLPDYMDLLMKKSVKKKYCYNEDIIDIFAKIKPDLEFSPGERYEYSNTGYAILASIIEKTSGMSYADFLQKYFFEPLDMRHSRVYNTRRTKGEVISNYAYGYVYSEQDKKYELPDSSKEYKAIVTKLDGIVGDGTVNTTIMDMIKWDIGLLNMRVLNAASLHQMYENGTTNDGIPTDYGCGVGVHSSASLGRIIEHAGEWFGYQTYICRFIDQQKMLVIFSNKDNPSNNIFKAQKRIASLFLSEESKK